MSRLALSHPLGVFTVAAIIMRGAVEKHDAGLQQSASPQAVREQSAKRPICPNAEQRAIATKAQLTRASHPDTIRDNSQLTIHQLPLSGVMDVTFAR